MEVTTSGTNSTTNINFASASANGKTLTLGAAGNTITDITFGSTGAEASTNNKIVLSQGLTTFNKTGGLSITNAQDLTFELGNTANLTLSTGLANAGAVNFDFVGASGILTAGAAISTTGTTTFNLGTDASDNSGTALVATITGTLTNNAIDADKGQVFNINAKNATLKYSAAADGDNDGLAFSAGNNIINFANTSAGGATLNWKNNPASAGDSSTLAIKTTGGTTTINFNNSGTIAGGVETNSSSGGSTTINVKNGAYAVINGAVTTSGTNSNTNISFSGDATADSTQGTLVIKGTTNSVSNVSFGTGNYKLSLTDPSDKGGMNPRAGGSTRRSLTIGTLDTSGTGSLTFISQATATEADTFVINAVTNKSSTAKYHLGVVLENGVQMSDVGAEQAVRLASVIADSGITFEKSVNVISGFTHGEAELTNYTTDKDGNTGTDYTSYYIEKIANTEVIAAEEEITATAFTLNYDLYMANLNSLNKRMGELRENAHSQGVWARVFNGALTNSFGLESKSNYTTIQAGYDYAFGFEGANNYLGVALSYALSTSTSQNAFDSEGEKRGIDNIYSNAVEVALYNSYVTDMGWYNDSIAKFSYITSKFDISNLNTGSVTNNDTTNFAFTLSDEVGYVFKLGENKEWSITPQIEATFGYFNQSDFKQTLADSTSYLASSADAVLTMRARAGSAFAYDFKNFTQKDNFNASVYVGAFYEYDYVSGGGITMSTDQINGVENVLSDLSSDGRVVMNVGTNMSIKDNTRLYFDFEKSFGGKINTDYQVNFGVRYSFGESNGYAPMTEKAEFKAPLKIEGEEAKEGDSEVKENSEEQTDKEAAKDSDSKE